MDTSKNRKYFYNKRVTVVGFGNSGLNAALLLKDNGAIVSGTDSGNSPSVRASARLLEEKGIDVQVGAHSEDFLKKSSLIVISPGVCRTSLPVRWAAEHGIPILGEMELGYRFCKGRIIAITGTNGKSTVTSLIGAILKEDGKDTVVCGNIGNSLCGEISRIDEKTWVVLEVSSFQLEMIDMFKPSIALILNITDDHMDRHADFEEYYRLKERIFSNQDESDTLVLNYDAANLRPFSGKARSGSLFYSRLEKTTGSYALGEEIFCAYGGRERKIMSTTEIRLKGLHNLENVLASSLVCAVCGVGDVSIRKAVSSFSGLVHRFQTIDTIDGVEYIDDSKGTTVDSVRRALESCHKNVILIAGGMDKKSDYSVIRDLVRRKAKHLVLIGEAKDAIRQALSGTVPTHEVHDMSEAVNIATSLAKKGDAVLLSPMCSSLDMYSSYRERGEVFTRAVNRLRENSRQANKA